MLQATLDVPLGSMDEVRYELRVAGLEIDLGGGGSSTGPFVVTGGLETLSVQGFDLQGGGSRLSADGEVGLTVDAASPLEVSGEIPLSNFAPLFPDAELDGVARIDLKIGGRLGALDPTGEVRLIDGRGRVGPLSWEDLVLEGTASDGVLTLTRAGVRVAGGEISARGTLPVGPRAQGTQTLEFEIDGVDPGLLVGANPGEPRLIAPVDVSGRIRATAPRLDAVEAEGEITGWFVDAGGQRLDLRQPARWRYGRDGLSLEGLRLEGDGGGGLGVEGRWTPDGPLRVAVEGQADLSFLNPLLGGEILLSGPGRLDLTVTSEIGRASCRERV